MARNKTAQGGISLRRKVTAWLAAILLVTMLSTGIATMAGQWTVRSFDMLLADNAVCYTVQNALKDEAQAFARYVRQPTSETEQAYLQREGDTMRRRTFLAGLGFAALQLAGCAAKLQTTPDYVLTYADNQPAGYPTTQGAQYFADLVQQQTGGKVVIQVKANGEYGSEQQVWEQFAIGGVDFARVSLSVATDDLPRLNVLLLPYLYRDADHMWRVLDGSIGAEFLQDFTA